MLPRLLKHTLSALKTAGILFAASLLLSCADEGPKLEPSVQARNLFYGLTANFKIGVSRLNEGLSVRVQSCLSDQAPIPSSSTELSYQCKLTATGDQTLEVIDANGSLVYSKSFSVPRPRVLFEVSEGEIEVELDPNTAPMTVDNFLRYVQAGFYQDLIFHRVIPGFVVQAGGYERGMVQRPVLFAPVPLESNRGLSNKRASLAMARTNDPDSASSQFFVNLVDNKFLDYNNKSAQGYAVFGEVVRGIDVIDTIALKPTSNQAGFSDVPINEIVIIKATRIR